MVRIFKDRESEDYRMIKKYNDELKSCLSGIERILKLQDNKMEATRVAMEICHHCDAECMQLKLPGGADGSLPFKNLIATLLNI